jgi:hypothetical protein
MIAREQLAQILGSRLGDAIFFGTAVTSSVIQAAGSPGGGTSASPNTLVVLV